MQNLEFLSPYFFSALLLNHFEFLNSPWAVKTFCLHTFFSEGRYFHPGRKSEWNSPRVESFTCERYLIIIAKLLILSFENCVGFFHLKTAKHALIRHKIKGFLNILHSSYTLRLLDKCIFVYKYFSYLAVFILKH